MTTRTDCKVAIFRPDDERIEEAVELVESLGGTPVPDPMLAIEETGALPRDDADYVIFTSKTGVELVENRWTPADETTVCAIGERTADALREAGFDVDLVPETYSSQGLVDALGGEVDGARVEVARSDHGSDVLLDGLEGAGAYVHETILYRLVRPEGAGESAALAADGDLHVALFTSSLTVEHFLEAAEARGVRQEAIDGLADATVGTIGEPTKETAEALGIDVDVVPETATFEALACETIEADGPEYQD
jgi:uroporphyrinogen-III synthase